MKNTLLIATLMSGLQALAGVTWYAVDPMSERPCLPHEAPKDGLKGDAVRIVAAKGEYEPGSFVLVSDADLGRVKLEVSDLKKVEKAGGGGEKTVAVFPKENIDLKNVKVWYQNGNSWYSYFQDTGLKLCPELLLNDEDLVKVDEQKVANYARVTEADGRVWYRWLTVPGKVDSRLEDADNVYAHRNVTDSFSPMKPNFCDAPSFQGVTLAKGVHKQIWLTVNVATNQPAGLYRGEVKVKGQGQEWSVPLYLRVLDFELPEPGCYADYSHPFGVRFNQYVSLDFIRAANGNDLELAKKQLRTILADFARHGDKSPLYRDREAYPEFGREAGQDFGNPHYNGGDMKILEKAEMRYDARRRKELCTRLAGGWYRPFLAFNNEYPLYLLQRVRDAGMLDIYKGLGFRFACEIGAGYEGGAHLIDRWWPPVSPDGRNGDMGAKLNKLGTDFGWYAVQHVGVENPAYCRRQYGFGPYRAGFTLDANYAHHLQGWNDIASNLYRPMMFVYGCGNGCLDTIAWEGFREGLDDIRYATKLQQLAAPHVEDPDHKVREAAKKAMKLLVDADGDDMDLSALRLEMIRQIEALNEVGCGSVVGARVPRARDR